MLFHKELSNIQFDLQLDNFVVSLFLLNINL